MAVLSDVSIEEAIASGRLRIDPYDPGCVEPCSVDLRLGHRFHVFRNDIVGPIDVRVAQPDIANIIEVDLDGRFELDPGMFVLCATLERVTLGDDLMAFLDGKSSLGRLGIHIHATAGVVDSGWDGHLTLELSNITPRPVLLYPGMRVGQIVLFDMTTASRRPYGTKSLHSKYQGADDSQESRYYENFEADQPL